MTSACVYCGLLELEVRVNGIDSSSGYTIENCVPCNFMKGTDFPGTLSHDCTYEFPEVPKNLDQKKRCM